MALQGTKALEAWCRRVTQNYAGVNILNMTTSWRNGLGFCAIIHHHCPELIDYDSLDPDDVFGNNELAFQVAEQHLGVPSLLDPQDMVECELLDRLSILTYLSQYFQAFHSQSMQTRVRRLGSMSKSSSANSDISEGGKRAAPTVGKLTDPCRVCNKSVYILERMNVGGRILHRTCFRCARCGTQLSLAGYYETEAGEYCCELCPDEENNEEKKLSTHLAVIRAPDFDDVDSGHSSEDSKDIEDEDVKEKHGVKVEVTSTEDLANQPLADHVNTKLTLTTKESITTEDLNANIAQESVNLREEEESVGLQSEDPPIHQSEVTEDPNNPTNDPVDDSINSEPTATSNICSEEIDENDNNIENTHDKIEDLGTLKSELDDKPLITVDYPGDKNPFGDDDDDEDDAELESNNYITNNASDLSAVKPCEESVGQLNSTSREDIVNATKQSLNPFGSDFESDEEPSNPTPSAQASQVENFNPESSILKDRKSLNPFGEGFSSDEECSLGSVSPSPSLRSQARTRKKRRAPLPPGSTPKSLNGSRSEISVPAPRTSLSPGHRNSSRLSSVSMPLAETVKRIKDENNMNRRSQILESIKNDTSLRGDLSAVPSETSLVQHSDTSQSDTTSVNQSDSVSLMSASTTTQSSSGHATAGGTSHVFSPMSDKAEEGQWRKKKGPAPPRPIPPKRTVKKLHRKAINQELFDIDVKQGELERQGVKLEKSIREICDKSDKEGEDRDSLGPEAEDLIIQLFDLVNEKNELFRRQTELIYMKKENRLEEQYADLEYQIRVIMSKPEGQKTEEEQRKEDKLIKKLVEVVGLRNEIVDCLEMDRLRELDEDTAIEDHMSNYAAVKPEETKKGLTKMLRIKKKKKKDRDDEKDIDTSELPPESETASTEKKKRSAKKKLLKYASKKLTFPH